jgi:hypothetical protein
LKDSYGLEIRNIEEEYGEELAIEMGLMERNN